MIERVDAIFSLVPDADVIDHGNSVTWKNYDVAPITEEQINAEVLFQPTAGHNIFFVAALYKNGSDYRDFRSSVNNTGWSGDWTMPVNALIYMNGTTDYVELYCYQQDNTSAGNMTVYGASNIYTYMEGFLARTA